MLANNSRCLKHWIEPSLQTSVCNFRPKHTWFGKTVTGHVPLPLRAPRITLPTLSGPDLPCFATHVPFWQTKIPYKLLHIYAPELRIIVSSECCQNQDLLNFASWSLSDKNVCFVLVCQTRNGHFKICVHLRWLYSWPCVWGVLRPRPHGDQGWDSNQIQASWLTTPAPPSQPVPGVPALIPWGGQNKAPTYPFPINLSFLLLPY